MQETTDQIPGGSFQWARLALWSSVVFLGLAGFAGSLIVYMPARFAVQQAGFAFAADRVSGSIWDGTAQFDGGHTVTWETSGWESLRRMSAVVNWRLTGPGTDLTGRVALPLPLRADRADLDAVQGILSWPLIEAALPGLPIRCDARATITGLRLALTPGARRAEGAVTAPAGTCARLDGALPPVATPALAASLSTDVEGLMAVLTAQSQPQTPLATARLTNDDRVILTIHAAGAVMVPGMPSSADSEIEVPLSALFP